MDSVDILNAPYAKVSYLPEHEAVLVKWTGTHTLDEYKKAFSACLDYQLTSKLPIHNYISDIRDQGIVNPESRKWFENVALPKSIEQGLQHAAVVFDGNVFKKYYLNMILQVANVYKLPLKFFTSYEDAFAWFKSFEK